MQIRVYYRVVSLAGTQKTFEKIKILRYARHCNYEKVVAHNLENIGPRHHKFQRWVAPRCKFSGDKMDGSTSTSITMFNF